MSKQNWDNDYESFDSCEFNDNNENNNNRCNSTNIMEQINELEKIQNKIEKDIRSIWEDIINPYINNKYKQQVLDCLTENDYHKFYNFMIMNNKTCIHINTKLATLYKSIE